MRSISFVTSIILVSILLTGCGSPVEEPTPTAVPTDTLVPTQPPPPPDTPTPMPEPTTAPIAITTFEDMEGIWLKTSRGFDLTLEIFKNGVVNHKTADCGGCSKLPDTWFEDGFLYIQETSWGCSQDQIGVFEVTGVPGEYLVFTLVDDPCGVDREFKGKWTEASAQ